MGLRIFVILLAVAIVWFAVRTYLGHEKSAFKERRPPKAIDMVRCSHCGTHLPKDEALVRDGHYFCSKAHLQQDAER